MAQRVYTVTSFNDEEWSEWAGVTVFASCEDAARYTYRREAGMHAAYLADFEETETDFVARAVASDGHLGCVFSVMESEEIR